MNVSIVPVPAFPAQATQLNISDVRVTLNESADCQWFLLDSEGKQVSPAARCSLTPEQYAGWGNDDLFFAQSIAANLGLQLA